MTQTLPPRHQAGEPASMGGKFAPAQRPAAVLEPLDDFDGMTGAADADAQDAPLASVRQIDPVEAKVRELGNLMAGDADEIDDVCKAVPNLPRAEVQRRWREILEAADKAELYSDELAAETAVGTANDLGLELNEFGEDHQDRVDEGSSFGYRFDRYAAELSSMWGAREYELRCDLAKADIDAASAAA